MNMRKLQFVWLTFISLLAISWNTWAYNTIGIVGTAANGWPSEGNNTDIAMIQDPDNANGWWLINQTLSVGAMKFRADQSWSNSWGNNGTLCGTSNGQDISISSAGNYDLYINTSTGYFCIKPTSARYGAGSIGLIGFGTTGSNAGWNADIDMTRNETYYHKWTLEITLFAGDVKFRANNSWDSDDWGATAFPSGTAILESSNNIPATAGTYIVRFNDMSGEYSFSGNSPYTSIGLIGSSLPNGFDGPDTDMTQTSLGARTWTLNDVTLTEGEVKFRADDAWTNNWGSSAFPSGTGANGGANIPVAPGVYDITFNDETGAYSFVGDYISFTSPAFTELFPTSGENITFSANATNTASTFKVYVDDVEIVAEAESNVSSLSYVRAAANETIIVRFEAVIDGETVTREKTYTITLRAATTNESRPNGVKQGINYVDANTVTLVLLAPNKEYVYAVGDFNNWTPSNSYLMKKDGEYFWITLTGLTSGQEYVYQYWMADNVKVGDPYADKVADPWNDEYIDDEAWFANGSVTLPAYNQDEWGIASVFQTNQTPYTWAYPSVNGGKPAQNDLVIYEVHLRDFINGSTATESRFDAMKEYIPYLKTLGINAIHFMPFGEFEGNDSWGYNPNYYFAVDKYYGSKTDLKELIDLCHENGIAVIQDIVLNHSYNSCPLVKMYAQTDGYAASGNPWFNAGSTAPHCYGWGSDFNHESTYTEAFVDDVLEYWTTEFNIDGFRFDFTKGFTNNNSCDNYDQARVDNIFRMANQLKTIESDAYVILEHFNTAEEDAFTDGGLMVWGNINHQYREAVKGYPGNGSFGSIDSYSGANGGRGWGNRNLIGYMESHDENRVGYDAKNFGQVLNSYDVKEKVNYLQRTKAAMGFFLMVPGPKMIWQWGEIGYDFSIDYCTNGTNDLGGGCRTGRKPTPWIDGVDVDGNEHDYLNPLNLADAENDAERLKLFRVTAALNKLRQEKSGAFAFGSFNWKPGGDERRIVIQHESAHIVVIGNFGMTSKTIDPMFTHTGTWYDFFNGGTTYNVNDLNNDNITLKPGELRLFIDVNNVTFPANNLMSLPSFTANNLNMYVVGDFGSPVWTDRIEMNLVSDNQWEIAEFDYNGGAFKFNNALTFDSPAKNWGDSGADGTAGEGENNIDYPLPAGTYNLRFNDQTLAYSISTVNNRQMYIRGTFSDPTWSANQMTLFGEDTWTYNNITLSPSTEFKFSNTNNWSDKNFGQGEGAGVVSASGEANVNPNAPNGTFNVKFNDKTLTYEFTHTTLKPENIEVTGMTQTSVTLSWSAVANATGYEIYRRPAGTGNFVKVNETPNLTYTDNGLSGGASYEYQVRAKLAGNN
jgi:glycosidase